MVPVTSAGASGSLASGKDSGAEDFERRHCGGLTFHATGQAMRRQPLRAPIDGTAHNGTINTPFG